MHLKELSLDDCLKVRGWRNQQREMLRTSFLLTKEQQTKFYSDVVCNRNANARYWGIWEKTKVYKEVNMGHCIMQKDCIDFSLIGMCGLENIQWENRLAEINLIFNNKDSMSEYGEKTLYSLLHEGFNNMNLQNIFAEVYMCNSNYLFWLNQVEEYKCETAMLPYRKYFNGSYCDSLYINFSKERYNEYTVFKSTLAPN